MHTYWYVLQAKTKHYYDLSDWVRREYSKAKEELSYLRREDIGVIDDEDIYKALLDFRLRLEEADLIEPFEQASLVKSLDGKINKEILAEWNKALERLDYEEALYSMKTWNIFVKREMMMLRLVFNW